MKTLQSIFQINASDFDILQQKFNDNEFSNRYQFFRDWRSDRI